MGIRMLFLVLVLALLLLAPRAARAEEDQREPLIALSLSAGITGGGVAMMFSRRDEVRIGGAVLFFAGPTTGHWYAGTWGNGGTVLRMIGTAMGVYGLTQLDLFSDEDNDDGAGGLIIAGGVLYIAGGIYEIITAPSAVHDYNRRHAGIALTPLVDDRTTGLAVVGRF
jgi:hypothetical protein